MKIKYFILDFDGVVVDTEDVFAKFDCTIINKYLSKAGSPNLISYDEMRNLAGIPGEEKFKIICTKQGIDPAHYINKFSYERTEGRKNLFIEHPVTFGQNLMQFLQNINGRFALATNKESNKLLHDIKIMKLDTTFPIIVTADPPLRRKPMPDVIIEAIKKLNSSPSDCAYIGDNAADMQAAINADVFPIGFVIGSVKDKDTHADLLKKHGASIIIDDFNDLIPYI